jgi:hypothetical protein
MLGQGDPGPRILPLVLGVLIAVLGAGLGLRPPAAVAGPRAEADETDSAVVIPAEPPLLRVAHAFNVVAYVALFERLGFTAATFIFLSLAIFLLGRRNLRGAALAALSAAIVTLAVGFGLKTGVGVQLPGVFPG